MAAFPYLTDSDSGQIARYARGADYHVVLVERLKVALKEFVDRFKVRGLVLVDDSPIPEVEAARLSGVGKTGQNGLCLCPPYGSYVVLGSILLDTALSDWAEPVDAGFCSNCGACQKACPTGALTGSVFNRAACLSHISQARVLTKEQETLLRAHPRHWGCDDCQACCPENMSALKTPLMEFYEPAPVRNYMSGMDLTGRSFAWRGREVLERNENLFRESSSLCPISFGRRGKP